MQNAERPNGLLRGFQWCIVCIIAVLIADLYLVRPSIFFDRGSSNSLTKAKIMMTKAILRDLHAAVERFRQDTGRYPSRRDGLSELMHRPADVTGWKPDGCLECTGIPQDGWKRDFVYVLTPESSVPFVIISFGADGQPGGTDENADLYSTEVK